jgi:nucleotide-binding universal stress UspA family protein
MHILLGVDQSEDSRAIVAAIGPWAVRLGAFVDLVYVDVYDAWEASRNHPALAGVLRAELERLKTEDRGALEALREALRAAARGSVFLAEGTPAARLVALAAEHAYDLVAVGTHGRTGLAHLWLGSVAERVIRTSPRPTLVMRPRVFPLAPRGMLAVDLDGLSEPLVDAAGDWAARLGATLDLEYVQNPQLLGLGLPEGHVDVLLLQQVREVHEQAIARLAARLPEACRGASRVVYGAPAYTIVEDLAGYDFALVGTHQREGLDRLWLGSVAEHITRRASVPVLLLPGPLPPHPPLA